MSHTKKMNERKVYIYRQKIKFICYLVIITRSNVTKIVSELARYLTNFSSNHLKATNHCVKYLHATKFLVIRYSNLENEKLNNQISSLNKETMLL